MKHTITKLFSLLLLFLLSGVVANAASRQMERLDRGVVAVNNGNGVFVSWRFLGTDDPATAFNIYRDGTKLNASPVTSKTNYLDAAGNNNSKYVVKTVVGGKETEASAPTSVWGQQYKTLNLKLPTASGCTYSPNDMSVGDVDGDGQYELFVKWDPSNSKDNSQSGVTGNVFIDCYRLDGSFLWRIDLGRNIRAGAHYTQFQVYDFDGDGKAEMVCKTAPGTKDGKGRNVIMGNDDPNADYRNSSGYILSGPEYLTIFEGATGAEINTVAYNPARGTVSSWGDKYGNRVDRFLACTAYLDGVHPSIVMCRGYYTWSNLVAYDFKGGKLVQRWEHFSRTKGQGAYGEGFHNLSVADVDNDGFDEIIYGSACIDHDGKLMYRTGFGHGDAQHVSKMDPASNDYLGWFVHEETGSACGFELRNLRTGKVVFGEKTGTDVGRGCAADIDASHPGFECWSTANGNVYDVKGNVISNKRPSVNFRIYWDGDLQDELLDGTKIDKWNGNGTTRLITLQGSSCNGTKSTPCLSADILGDWREEVITWNTNNPAQIYIYTTTIESPHRLFTPMHDAVYRLGVAWQNTAYNQPPHLGFYIGGGLDNVRQPDIFVPGSAPSAPVARDTATIGRKGSYGARNQTIVAGKPMDATVYTYTNADALLVKGALPFGVQAEDKNGTLTISGAPAMVGTYIYTLATDGPNVNVEGPGGTLTVVPDPAETRKKVAYVTDATVANYVNDQVLLPSLLNADDYYVVQVDARQTNVDLSAFDLVVICEVAASNAPIMLSLKGIDKPVLNMKVHAYKTSDATWSWAAAGYGDNADATAVTIAEGQLSHPVFKNLNAQGGQLSLLNTVNAKGLTYMNPAGFTSLEGTVTPLANISGTENVCIFEAAPGAVISGTAISEPFLQIGINSSSLGELNDQAVALVHNACRYLLGLDQASTGCGNILADAGLMVSPNPAAGTCHLLFTANQAAELPVLLINAQGALVRSMSVKVVPGVNAFTIARNGLPAGIYYLRLGNEGVKLIFY